MKPAPAASSFTSDRSVSNGTMRAMREFGRLLHDEVHLVAARHALGERERQGRFVTDRATFPDLRDDMTLAYLGEHGVVLHAVMAPEQHD